MTFDDRLIRILEGLLSKSRRSEVRWVADGVGDAGDPYGGIYTVDFDGLRLTVEHTGSPTVPEMIRVSLARPDGRAIYSDAAPEGGDRFPLYSALAAEAARAVAGGWDDVLDRIERSLNVEPVVGVG